MAELNEAVPERWLAGEVMLAAAGVVAVTQGLVPSHRFYLLVRWQAVEARALGTTRKRRTPEDGPSVAEAGPQRQGGPGCRSAVQPPQAAAGSGHRARAQ